MSILDTLICAPGRLACTEEEKDACLETVTALLHFWTDMRKNGPLAIGGGRAERDPNPFFRACLNEAMEWREMEEEPLLENLFTRYLVAGNYTGGTLLQNVVIAEGVLAYLQFLREHEDGGSFRQWADRLYLVVGGYFGADYREKLHRTIQREVRKWKREVNRTSLLPEFDALAELPLPLCEKLLHSPFGDDRTVALALNYAGGGVQEHILSVLPPDEAGRGGGGDGRLCPGGAGGCGAGPAGGAGNCRGLGEGGMNYVISDIHGCFDKYREMLELIEFLPRDTLYVLGDVIDRGPDGIKILQDMNARPNVFPILGNHEFTAAVCLPWLMEEITRQSIAALDGTQIAALSEWLVNGGEPTVLALAQLSREEREDILEYLREMELYAQVEVGGREFLLVHSALENFAPDRTLESYELQEFLFGRPEPGAVYYPDKTLVFGHTPTRILGGGDKIIRRKSWIDIDCGCVFKDGRLGCLCLDTMEEFYV